jgi:DNA-binding transcriptional ArsR family regulator
MLRNALPDEALEALGNAERRGLLRLLAEGPKSVGELAGAVTISRPAVSRHLKVLEAAKLVRHEASGTRNVYALDHAGFAATAAWLNGFWDEAGARLRLVAENLAEEPRGG